MLEELLTNTMFTPAAMGAIALAAVVFFVIGRVSMSGARKREEMLKRDVLEAKASVPQLESSIRNRDLQISRLQEEVADLNERANTLLRDQDRQANALRSAEREAKNLTSELNAVRGVRQADDNLVMEGFEDEVAAEPGDSPIATQLRKTEALYEKLKGALIKRDERIEELELLLAGESSPAEPLQAEAASSDEVRALEDRLTGYSETIESLTEQVSELRKEKEMLEDLASRRSKSNRALKDASAEIEARVPALEQELAARDEIIVAREASIKRLLNDADTARNELAARDASIESLQADVATRDESLAASSSRQSELESIINRREERITGLEAELLTTLDLVKELQAQVEQAGCRLTEQQATVDRVNEQLARRDQVEESLNNTLRDRDFRIDALSGEKAALEAALRDADAEKQAAHRSADQIRLEALDQQQLTDKRQRAMDAEHEVAERQTAALKREIEDLNSNLAQHQQWMDKLKATLEERENRSKDQQQRLDEITAELDQANDQLRKRHDERQMADDARHELEREIVSLKSKTEQTLAELSESAQTLSVYKSMLADKEFRIESLEQELSRLASSAAGQPALPAPAPDARQIAG